MGATSKRGVRREGLRREAEGQGGLRTEESELCHPASPTLIIALSLITACY